MQSAGDTINIGGFNYRPKIRFYTLVLARAAVAGAQYVGQMQIDPGVEFYMETLHAADTADGLVTNTQEDWSIQAQDNDGAYLWSDGLAPRSAFFGTREREKRLNYPMVLRGNTRITWTLTNNAAPVAGNATLVLGGYSLIPVSM